MIILVIVYSMYIPTLVPPTIYSSSTCRVHTTYTLLGILRLVTQRINKASMSRKIGLCIGINYRDHKKGRLQGCVNDARNLRQFLQDVQGFHEVIVMTDEESNTGTALYPTGQNIIQHLYDLALRTHMEEVDHIWISYSGHGSQTYDTDGDEVDGLDETILPVDYITRGMITDDLLFHMLNKVHSRTKCTVLMDCCHSGTILDLPYKLNGTTLEKQVMRKVMSTDVLMISGCKDAQTAADVNGEGAMTRAFLDTLSTFDHIITLRGLLFAMQCHIQKRGLKQVPQLSLSREYKLSTLFLSLVGDNTQSGFMS